MKLSASLLALVAAAALAAGDAAAKRFAIGVAPGASLDRVARELARVSGGEVSHDLAPIRALTLVAGSSRGLRAIAGVAYVERVDIPRRLAFLPPDPLVARQWYLAQTRAFDAWPEPPVLAGTRVAIIDSGIDAGHPEFEGRIAEARSFVGGNPRTDQLGHGTFVAGIIAANLGNGQGIAGMAFPAQLLVAKVVRDADRSISVEAEARAIRWAVDQGAHVINLSLGGLRDPFHPGRDTFSQLEADAVAYAYRNGVVVVAAVGNADSAPRRPWRFASYPAALPHVIGVSALARDGSVPLYSHRDPIYNDIAAPGEEILSTLPRELTAERPDCPLQGYSECGPEEYRQADGTSFAAPQVAAAAALLLGVRPELKPSQVMHLLTRTATDATPALGCRGCPTLRDAFTGWGRLDVASAVAQALGRLPPADRRETNDEAGFQAATLWGAHRQLVRATIDYWDDQTDVYRIRLHAGQTLTAWFRGPRGVRLILWRPGTRRVEGLSVARQRRWVAQSVQRGAVKRFSYVVPERSGGWYYLQVKIETPGADEYTLAYKKRWARRPRPARSSTA